MRRTPLVDGELQVRNGVMLHIELGGIGEERLVGYRAQRHTDLVDVDRVGAYRFADFWEAMRARTTAGSSSTRTSSTSSPRRNACTFPPDWPPRWRRSIRHGRVPRPLRRLLRSRLRLDRAGPRQPGVLEVRSHEVPFILDDGQMVCRLAYEKMAADAGRPLRRDRHLQLPGPGAQALEALPPRR